MNQSNKISFRWPILGHSQIKKYLQSSIVNDKLNHAYLFYGPANTGKFLMATYLAASLLCQSDNDKKPCQHCTACKQISKKINTNLLIVKKDKDKKNISIKQIRTIQQKLSLKSFLSEYKIIIIDEAEVMTEEAANALLKTLEEPHAKTIFILVAKNKEILPDTISSRCQTLSFNLIPTYQIENWLITLGKSKKDAQIIAHFANGRPGLANILLSNNLLLEEREARINKLIAIINGDLNQKFHNIAIILDEKRGINPNKNISDILEAWLYFFRDMLLIKNKSSKITNILFKSRINQLIKKYPQEKIIKVIHQINQSKKLVGQSVNPRLILENLAISL